MATRKMCNFQVRNSKPQTLNPLAEGMRASLPVQRNAQPFRAASDDDALLKPTRAFAAQASGVSRNLRGAKEASLVTRWSEER